MKKINLCQKIVLILISSSITFCGCRTNTVSNTASEPIAISSETENTTEPEIPSSSEKKQGIVVTIPNFYSPQLNTEHNVLRIYLPPNYEKSNKSYPVVYMPDGQNLFSSSTATYGKSWLLGNLLDRLAKEGRTDGIIVVGIDSTARRNEEYNLYLDSFYGDGEGLANETCDFYVETVKEYIDENYRTLPDKEHTAIIGASYGAVVSFNATVRYSDVFGYVGMFSYCDNQDSAKMTTFLKENMIPDSLSEHYIYFFTAKYDFARQSTYSAYTIAEENGLKHIILEEDENGQHDEYSWGPAFENCLDFFGWLQ
ncbi:MAG: alpha/beta hydrolase [Lachnospiraceae bacterium]|nr:alpha/beta hydrolase [Lachnospiraceae bacterium]